MTQLNTSSSATTFSNPVYELESDIGTGTGTISSTKSSVVPASVDTGYVTEPSSSVIGNDGVVLDGVPRDHDAILFPTEDFVFFNLS